MHKKFLPIFIGMSIISIILFSTYHILKQKNSPPLFKAGFLTYINKSHKVLIPYPDAWELLETKNPDSVNFTVGGEVKPISVKITSVQYDSLENWLSDQSWSKYKTEYTYRTSTFRYPTVTHTESQIFYSMIRPGTLVSVENGLSSEHHFHSVKIPLELISWMEPY